MLHLDGRDLTRWRNFLQSRWDVGRYSVLAGFVEIGESFEKAVAREVKEEAGIDIDVSSVR